jgi:hypothetical protein
MIDFQSYMYEVKEKTWEEFKEYILNEDSWVKIRASSTTLSYHTANPRRGDLYVIKETINDDRHLEVIFSDNTSSSYMKVDNEFFNRKEDNL